MNFRSLTIYGSCNRILDPNDKKLALECIVEHLVPGRTADARPSNPKELAATEVLSLALEQFTVKCREGEPIDKKSDEHLAVWAGVIPLKIQAGTPITDGLTGSGLDVPDYASSYHNFNNLRRLA